MFERTFSFCRRLVRKSSVSETAGSAVAHDDRRLWVRYDAALQTQVHVEQSGRAERVSAQVKDVSVGGANLETERSFVIGQIVSLELPSSDGQMQLVLACVVRCTPSGDGQWSLGCAFSRELAGADLQRFGAAPGPDATDEQRGWARHNCSLKAAYERIGEEDIQTYNAQVLNVSASGVGLILHDTIDPGALINLRLYDAEGELLRTILACVVHSTQRTNGDLVIGCNFIRELGEDELQTLLAADV
jgi:c-di-GMP-binding flagellar brake protein YcgR